MIHKNTRRSLITCVLIAIHTIWRERNRRRHGEDSVPAVLLIQRLGKNMRNQFTVIRRRGGKEYEDGMATWFDTR